MAWRHQTTLSQRVCLQAEAQQQMAEAQEAHERLQTEARQAQRQIRSELEQAVRDEQAVIAQAQAKSQRDDATVRQLSDRLGPDGPDRLDDVRRIYDLGVLNSLVMPLTQASGSTCWHECLLDQLDDALMACVTMFEITIGTTSCTYV